MTVIIPIYNCQNTIRQAISSIQNQKMIDIEIILVNDKSTDDSLKIVNNAQKIDKRIKLINNKKNMGTLYSRCIGVLQAKGKYIFPLDNDDIFFDDDIFNIVYEEAYNFNYDIVGFKAIIANNYKVRISQMKDDRYSHNYSFAIFRPKLRLFGISKKNRPKDREVRIWSKCIKTSIYEKAVNLLGKKGYSLFMSWAEDKSMLFILFSIAQSYRYIIKYGIFKFERKESAGHSMPKSHKLFGEIFFLDVLFNFSEDNFKSKKYIVYRAIKIRNSIFFKSLNEINKNYLKRTLKKILSCLYINNEDKTKLKIIYKEFI